ncbi:hypothetical protein LELG_02381 [Lodderomyces elongisporus NRRL YB-4239]|uniref:Major facilitator superfamily (MFS) profile domain-containing protein n=1 Tax=Lodderomyces elongisporus (strain ATCC 11503 / CBS 2605 / JCM 1781 / NBRC 1676 / NRRL YB-4239) TaxID=379508 RepID=A5DYE4_LODEL|nr:hypothetical protein LELG_02381 [Lodderomyces elongisporus NRRL YB-4239]
MHENPSIRDQLSGFPIFQMGIVCILSLSEPIAFASYLSYIYFMIKSFGIVKTDSDVSRYSGYLAAAYSFAQLFSIVQWSKASDKFGRKPVLLLGCIGTALSMILFGFSSNFYMAFISRMLMGLLNGNVSIMRTVTGEIAVEKRHQGIAFSNLSVIWSLGKAVGYYMAGKLTNVDHFRDYNPDEKANVMGSIGSGGSGNKETHDIPFFVRYPFAFSNIVVSMLILVFALIGCLFLKETNIAFKGRRDRGLELGNKVLNLIRAGHISIGETHESLIAREHDPVIESGHDLEHEGSQRFLDEYEEFEMTSRNSSFESDEDKQEKQDFVLKWPITVRILCSCLHSFQYIVFTEFLPVLLASTVDAKSLKFPFHIRGGFGFKTNDIGKLLSVTGVLSVIAAAILFPFINKHMNLLFAFRLGLFMLFWLFACLPLIIFTTSEYTGSKLNPSTPLLYLGSTLIAYAASVTSPPIVLSIHRATPKRHRAVVNGYTITGGALAKFISPLLWGQVMTLMDHQGYGGIGWLLAGLSSIVNLSLTFFFKQSDEHED